MIPKSRARKKPEYLQFCINMMMSDIARRYERLEATEQNMDFDPCGYLMPPEEQGV